MRTILSSMALFVQLCIPAVAGAEIFSWTDSSGSTHIADDISKVPPEYQDQARARQLQDEDTAPARKQKDNQQNASKYKKTERSEQTGNGDTDKYGRGEDYWRERADCLREQLSDLQEEYESTGIQEQECEKRPFDYTGKRPDCSIYRQQKAALERAIERYRKAINVDLPDEARKAGAYPGWLR